MKRFWQISHFCSACGKGEEASLRLLKEIDRDADSGEQIAGSFEIKYFLCDDCYNRRGILKGGFDLLPIDGNRNCFYCGDAAQCVSENHDVFHTARQCHFHFTCRSCNALEQAVFQRLRNRTHQDYPKTPKFPIEPIIEMDAEVRAAAG